MLPAFADISPPTWNALSSFTWLASPHSLKLNSDVIQASKPFQISVLSPQLWPVAGPTMITHLCQSLGTAVS